MSRPLLHRGVSGGRIGEDSIMKEKYEMQEIDRRPSPRRHSSPPLHFHASISSPVNHHPSKSSPTENGFGSESTSYGASRNRQSFTLLFLKFSLVLILISTLLGSFWWAISISASSRGNIHTGYRRLQEQLITDLTDIGALSVRLGKLRDVEFCPPEYENFVPCFNVSQNLALGYSDGGEYDRQCLQESLPGCIVLPPKNYRIPLRWPTGRDVIWIENVKITAQEVLSSGSLTKRMMMLEEDQVSFRSSSVTVDGVEDYSHQIAEMIGLRSESNFNQAGIRTVLDIGCGYGSFGAHLFSKQLLTMCIANYEFSGSQVQLTLERGLPAMVGSFTSKKLPYPYLSFDMVHCARCGIDWEQRDGIFFVEVDRVLKPGGYFVWTSPVANTQKSKRNKENQSKWNFVHGFAEKLCWDMLSQEDETVVWKKTSTRDCYASRKSGMDPPICSLGQDIESPYYLTLKLCIGGTQSRRWIPIEERTVWPSRANLNSTELEIYGVQSEDFAEDSVNWNSVIRGYWSLLSPMIFSDRPKRLGDEDPSPPFNMLRNVLDMNGRFGGFNAALLDAGKTVWVMNVVPTTGPNYLNLIFDRGFIGVLHDWCESFPSYPRSYDMVHAEGLLSLQVDEQYRCSMLDLFLEIDRILRPEGWVIIRDTIPLIKKARALALQLKWDARMVEIEGNSDDILLVCQKPFIKK